MADLRAIFRELGFPDAQTVLQSGSVVFSSDRGFSELEAGIEKTALERLGLKGEVHVRTQEDWSKVIRANPFPEDAASDPSHLLVSFYRSDLDADIIETALSKITGPEKI